MPRATPSHLILGPRCCIHIWTRLQSEAGWHHSKRGTCLLGCSQISCFQSFRTSRLTSEFRWLNLLWGAIFALGPTSGLSWVGLTSVPGVASCKHSIPGTQWTFLLMLMQLPQNQRFTHGYYLWFSDAEGVCKWLLGSHPMPRAASCKHSIPGSQWTFMLMLMQLPQSQRFPHACYLWFSDAEGVCKWLPLDNGIELEVSLSTGQPTPHVRRRKIFKSLSFHKDKWKKAASAMGRVSLPLPDLGSSREEETRL